MTSADGSNCQRRSPCAADVGKAWWLLCHASPNDSGASQARLRDSSPVDEILAAEEVAQRVDRERHVVEHQNPHRASPQQTEQCAVKRSAERIAKPKRDRQAEQNPEHEAAVDGANDGVGEQVGRVALLIGKAVAEDPAQMGVPEAAQRRAPALAVADVRAVRVALLVGVGVVLAMVGDPLDRRSFDAMQPRIVNSARSAGVVSKARWVSRRWKPTVMPRPVGT